MEKKLNGLAQKLDCPHITSTVYLLNEQCLIMPFHKFRSLLLLTIIVLFMLDVIDLLTLPDNAWALIT